MSTHTAFVVVAFAPCLLGLQPRVYLLFRWSWFGPCVFFCILRSLAMSRVALGFDAIFCEEATLHQDGGARLVATFRHAEVSHGLPTC